MHFAAVLDLIADFLDARQEPWAVVGGVALAAYGIARTTLDLDLAVDARSQEPLVAFLEVAGYQTLHRSAGYSNHLHADPERGRVDLVYLRGDTSRRVFEQARVFRGPAGRPIRVPRPEHLAAMKVQAMRDDPSRTFQEMADLRALLARPDTDRDEVRAHFERHGMRNRFDEIVATL